MDRFSTRRVDTTREPYLQLARDANLWRDPGSVLGSALFNQLVRVHALATSVARRREIDVPVSLLTIGHRYDVKTRATLEEYRERMTSPDRLLAATLDQLLDAMSTPTVDPAQLRMTDGLRRRYVNEHESESAWRAVSGA